MNRMLKGTHRFCMRVALPLLMGGACTTGDLRASQALSVQQIVAKHIDAIGGQRKLARIQSIQTSMIVNERGVLHPLFADRKRPNLLRVRMMHGGELVFTEVYTGTRSWEGAPGKELCKPDSAATGATRHAAEQFDDPLVSAMALAAGAHLAGQVRLGGRDVYQIDITERDGSQGSYFVDSQSFLLSRVRSRRPLHPNEPVRLIELVLDDYRPVSGVLFAFRSIEREVETGEPLTVSLTLWAEANVPISGNVYAMPASCPDQRN